MTADKLKSSPLLALSCGVVNLRIFKVNCPECGSPAVIRKTDWKDSHKKYADMYCACTEVECGHTFVFNVMFSHTLSPSALAGDRLVKELLGQLTAEQRQFALDLLQTS